MQNALEVKLPEIFNYLEQQINNRHYLVGDALSLADISITVPFLNLELAGYSIDNTRWSGLRCYVDEITKKPFIKEALIQVRKRLSEK